MSQILLTKLRDLLPVRPLHLSEAFRLAELQAAKLLSASGITDGPVPDSVITDLARVRVLSVSGLPRGTGGATTWSGNVWTIVLNADDSELRQRFSMAHELKHAIDADLAGLLYQPLWNMSGEDFAEKVCNHFAASLLMPRAWVKRAYFNEGIRHLPAIARRFQVSEEAMERQLVGLRLLDRAPRCLVGWPARAHRSQRSVSRHVTDGV